MVLAGPVMIRAALCRHLAPHLQQRPTPRQWRRVEAMKVVAWLRPVADSELKEGISLGLVMAPADRVFKVVTDNARFAEFLPHVAASTVEVQPDGSIVNHQIVRLDLPGRLLDREYEYKVRIVNDPNASAEVRLRESRWTHVKGFGNIAESRGAWRVFDCGEAALVEYRLLSDPGEPIPRGVKNWLTKRSLSPLIEAVRDRVPDPSYDDD